MRILQLYQCISIVTTPCYNSMLKKCCHIILCTRALYLFLQPQNLIERRFEDGKV